MADTATAPTALERAEPLQSRELDVRAVREESREVDFIASTETIDSHGTIVKANWDLKRYARNPVVLYSHDTRSLPIGTAKTSVGDDDALLATVRFASEKANPFAEQVFQGVREGTIRGMSVGFYPRTVREEKHNNEYVLVLDDNELRELSIVPVPSNPDALAQLRQRAAPRQGDPQTEAHVAPKTPANERGEARKDISMSPEEIAALKKQSEERAAEARVATQQLTEARAERATIETQNRALVAERDALKARAEKAEGELIERVVDSFVGVKITPAERGSYAKLARQNPELFAELMEQRSPLPIAVGVAVMGTPKTEARASAVDADGSVALARLNARLSGGAAKGGA